VSVGGGRATDEHLAIAPPLDACIVLSLARFKNLSKQLFAILSVGGEYSVLLEPSIIKKVFGKKKIPTTAGAV